MTTTIKNKTARGAANEFTRVLRAKAIRMGLVDAERAQQAIFTRPGEYSNGGYEVVWEEGPYEWAVYISGGGSLLGDQYGYSRPAEIDLLGARGWYGEPYNGHILTFWENKW